MSPPGDLQFKQNFFSLDDLIQSELEINRTRQQIRSVYGAYFLMFSIIISIKINRSKKQEKKNSRHYSNVNNVQF